MGDDNDNARGSFDRGSFDTGSLDRDNDRGSFDLTEDGTTPKRRREEK